MFVKKLFVSKALLLFLGWCFSLPNRLQAQIHIGPEVGTAISAIVPSNQTIPYYAQRIGVRGGMFAEVEISSLFAIRSGVFYTLRGFHFGNVPNPYNTDKYWDMHSLNIPMMGVLKLNQQVQVALGVEMNTVLGSNLPLIRIPSIQLGMRGECAFHITEQLRVAAYYMHGFNKLLEIRTRQSRQNDFYNNIIAGISLSYVLISTPQSSSIPVDLCPPFL